MYNNLILIHQKNVQTFTESLVLANNCRKGNIESISEQTESITLKNLSQIFESLSQSTCTSMSAYSFPKSILIEGYPGIGKTTLAKEISLEWAEGRLLSSEKLVLLLLLRDSSVQKITSEYDLFKHFTVSVEEAKSMSLYFQNSHGQGLVVIIDGFDELNSELRQISFFRELIEGEIFPNALIVVTSRPSASLCLHEHVHRRIVILGFEQASKEQFIIDALKDYPSKLQELQQHFNRNPYMDSICYIPLNMSIMVYLCLTGYLPPTTTKMYETFILHTVCRHLKRTNIVSERDGFTTVSSFPPPVLATLTKMEEIAFKSLLDDKIVFTLEDLPDVCMEDPTCYGLLQSNECYASTYTGTPVLSLNFLHLGIQEYFAAKYVANLPDNDVYELMKETFLRVRDTNHTLSSASVRLSNMWVLFFGISGGRSAAVKKFLSTDYKPPQSRLQSLELSNSYSSDDYSTAPSSYYSSQCSSLSEPSSEEYFSLSSDSDRLLESSNTDSPSCVNNPSNLEGSKAGLLEATALPLTLQANAIYSEPMFISQDILQDSVSVLYLFQCFQEAENDELCTILSCTFDDKSINLSNQRLLPHQILSLGFFLSHTGEAEWNSLSLHKCHIGDHGMSLLHQYLCKEKQKLQIKKIYLNSNDLTVTSGRLLKDLIICLHPQCLMLDSNNIGDAGLKEISSAIISSSVKELWVGSNGITPDGASAIADMMVTLKVLENSYNEIADSGAELLSNGISKSNSIKKLNIRDNKIGPLGGKALACALSENKSLETLWFNNNIIGDDGALAIAESMPKITVLKDLSLTGDVTMSEESVLKIVQSLHCNTSVAKFHLPYPLGESNNKLLQNELENINKNRTITNWLSVY